MAVRIASRTGVDIESGVGVVSSGEEISKGERV